MILGEKDKYEGKMRYIMGENMGTTKKWGNRMHKTRTIFKVKELNKKKTRSEKNFLNGFLKAQKEGFEPSNSF